MRWLGWLVVLLMMANGALYAYMKLNEPRQGETMVGHEPLHSDKIKFASVAELQNQKKSKEAKTENICMDWSGIASGDIERARKQLDGMGLSDKLTELVAPSSYWVYIPPQKNMKDAEKKLSEVKKMGIEDHVEIEKEGKWRFAVNLGLFATEEEATKYLGQLKSKGVKSAKTGRRDGANEIAGWHIQDVDDSLADQLSKLTSNFSGSNLKQSTCN